MIRAVAGVSAAFVLLAVASPRQASESAADGQNARASGVVRYVSVNGRDSGRCTQAAPCASFARAYLVAQPGDTVEVAAGSYPAQTLPPDPTKTSSQLVLFRPAQGAAVTIAGGFTAGDRQTGAGAKHFELRDFTIAGNVSLQWGSEDVTLRNIDAPDFDLSSTKNVRIYGGDWGPAVDAYNSINGCGVQGCFGSQDILIDGATFHDYTIDDPAIHAQCMMIWPGQRVTVRNSTFRNCTDFDVFVDPYNTALVGPIADVTFENNFFDLPMPGDTATVTCDPNCPRGGTALRLGAKESWGGAQIRYNSFLGELTVDPLVQNVVVKGNVAPRSDSWFCGSSGIQYDHNVWSGAKCSSTDRQAPLDTVFVGASSASFDLRLRDGAAAIGAGDPTSYPSDDHDGQSRPQGVVDAGADERP